MLVGEENPLTRQPGAVACLRAGLLRRSSFASGSSASPPPIYDFDLPRALKLSVMALRRAGKIDPAYRSLRCTPQSAQTFA